jgi:hypothetical protein
VSALANHYCGELAKRKKTQRCDADDLNDSARSVFVVSVFIFSSVENMTNEEMDSGQGLVRRFAMLYQSRKWWTRAGSLLLIP